MERSIPNCNPSESLCLFHLSSELKTNEWFSDYILWKYALLDIMASH